MIRLERVVRPDVILVSPPSIEVFYTIEELFNKFNQFESL
jgi:hypothetical protein